MFPAVDAVPAVPPVRLPETIIPLPLNVPDAAPPQAVVPLSSSVSASPFDA